jgi:uncharacterized membrane protein YhaH (DUF805 family)
VRGESKAGWITFVWWLFGAAGVVVTGVFSGWTAAVIFAVAYLAVFIPGRLLLRRRQRQ